METKIKRDNLHWSWRPLDGFNKMINCAITAREPGKTDSTWWEKIFCSWVSNKKPWMYIVRKSVEISEASILDIEDTINKWSVNPIDFKYSKGNFKDGIVDIKIGKELFFRIVSLNIDLRRLKLAKIPNIGGIFFDEYVIDPRSGEKYLKDEVLKIKECYTTWRRSYEGKGTLKLYIAGNPYSLYLPIFLAFNVDVNALKKDKWIRCSENKITYTFNDGIVIEDYEYKLEHNIYTNDLVAVEWGILHPVLRQYLKIKNPLYVFDEDYSGYALEGCAINDKNIKLSTMPPNYQLRFVFRISDKNIAIYQNNYFDDGEDRYFCDFIDDVGAKRTIYCFNFEDLINQCQIMSTDDRNKLNRFKVAMRKRQIVFSSVSVYYLIEEIYKQL